MPYTYAFVGLTPSERALLKSIFAVEGGSNNGLVRVRDTAEADLLVVNGDDAAVAGQLRQANPGALMVLVGQPRGGALTGLPALTRPLDLTGVVSVLSQLDWPQSQQERHPPIDFSDGTTFAFSTVSASQALHSGHSELPPGGSSPQPLASPGSSFGALPDDPEADVMMVVGPWRDRPPSLPLGISKLGYRVCVADGAEQARRALKRRPVSFVFMDQASLGAQLLPLARELAARRHAPGGPPYLVVVARHDNLFERLRARLAGCTWMMTPVHGKRLVAFFARRGLIPRRR
jgi:hypothetical protein